MIIPLNPPKTKKEIYLGPHLQAPLYYCMNPALNNPFLNALYKNSISYTERWYLELRKRIIEDNLDHPVVQVVYCDDTLKKNLLLSAVIDGAAMRCLINNPSLPEYHVSAGINLKKLRRWAGFFTSLLNHQDDISLCQDDQVRD